MLRNLALLVVIAGATLTGQGAPPLAITNVTVIDATGAPPRRATVVVRDGAIAEIGAAPASAAGMTIVDGTGRYLIPGLWDMHVHLATRPEPMLAESMILPLLLAHGVVGVRDMGGPLERVLELRARVASGAQVGPRILTPGPFVDGPGDADAMFRRAGDAAAAAAVATDLKRSGVDFLKTQAGLTAEAHRGLIAAARAADLSVAGHVPIAMTADAVIASGQRTVEHVSPALVGDGLLLLACSSRADALVAELRAIERDRGKGSAEALAAREAALRRQAVETYAPARARALGGAMKGRPVWIVPTLTWSASLRPRTRSDDGRGPGMDYVPTALRTRWLERRAAFIARQPDAALAEAAGLAVASARAVADMKRGGARVLAGTDAFDAFVLPGLSLHQELQALVAGGLTPLEALQAATRDAAAARGAAALEGTIAVGKRADLLLLDADPTADITHTTRIRAVVRGGTLHDRGALDRLLAEVRAFASR